MVHDVHFTGEEAGTVINALLSHRAQLQAMLERGTLCDRDYKSLRNIEEIATGALKKLGMD
jgi:hypothetical protein